ncbi:hypothetical protein Mpe_B0400 (plasmid) [Methylibium petroleiphilum PM1]|uniref:Uncharacterized protein n=2 Tax=Methylibium TaxID=316612 RepID=A2SNN6_METPP|nr:hypothetical protein Mpe_B0400 [Methylibium petroleiphilum PM1]
MADICDMAADRMEVEADFQARIAAQRAATRELEPNGFCHNPLCGLDLFEADGSPSSVRLFCDAHCSAEYERAKHTKRRPS